MQGCGGFLYSFSLRDPREYRTTWTSGLRNAPHVIVYTFPSGSETDRNTSPLSSGHTGPLYIHQPFSFTRRPYIHEPLVISARDVFFCDQRESPVGVISVLIGYIKINNIVLYRLSNMYG